MWVGGGGWVGGMRANTETSRSSARARAATTMSIKRSGDIIVEANLKCNLGTIYKDNLATIGQLS